MEIHFADDIILVLLYLICSINLLEDLQDPIETAQYLNAALKDGSEEMFLMALRDVAEARGMVKLTEQFASNHEDTFLSEKKTPKLNEFLKSMGLKLAVEVEVPLGSESV